MSKLFVDEIASKTGTADALTIDSSGFISIATALVGNNMVYGWNAVTTTTVNHNSITTINLSTTNYAGYKVTSGANNRLTPTVAGRYLVVGQVQASGTGSSGYTPSIYLFKNGANHSAFSGIRNYAGSSTLDWPVHFSAISMNGTTDYLQLAAYQNSSNNFTANGGSLLAVRLGG
tara:strand:+ start:533 stop:1057 length:525 start_codon:yes stop_codon:yes gene_type:complete